MGDHTGNRNVNWPVKTIRAGLGGSVWRSVVKHSSILIVLAAALGAVPAASQDHASELQGVSATISLDDALRIALENNLDLVVARKDPRIAQTSLEVETAACDSLFSASGSYQSTRTETLQVTSTEVDSTEFQFTSKNQPYSGAASLFNRLRFGGEYELRLSAGVSDPDASRRFITTGIFDVSDFESDTWRADLSYTMPLLRGFGTETNTVNVLIAQSNVTLSRYELQRQAETTLKAVEDAYWDVVAARAALDVAQESLRLAKDLLDLNRKKVEVGTLAPIEVTQAEAGVASREEDIIRAETALQNAEDVLLQLLAVPPDDSLWDSDLNLTDRPKFEKSTVDIERALDLALTHRAEVLSAQQALEDRRLTERVAKNGTKHGLNLSANVGYGTDTFARLGLTEVAGVPTDIVRFEQDDDNFDWGVTLTYSYPLGNQAAKASYAGATLSREKGEVALDSAELAVRTDVRIAARNVESGVKRVDAARANTVLQRKTLDAEQKKFENGMSTSFEVLRIQTDLSNARLSEIRAILDYTKALAALERAQGTLLEARGLKLEEAEETE
jgi:outer membrane protein TolC